MQTLRMQRPWLCLFWCCIPNAWFIVDSKYCLKKECVNECVDCLGEGNKGVSAVRVEAVSVISFLRYLWGKKGQRKVAYSWGKFFLG